MISHQECRKSEEKLQRLTLDPETGALEILGPKQEKQVCLASQPSRTLLEETWIQVTNNQILFRRLVTFQGIAAFAMTSLTQHPDAQLSNTWTLRIYFGPLILRNSNSKNPGISYYSHMKFIGTTGRVSPSTYLKPALHLLLPKSKVPNS